MMRTVGTSKFTLPLRILTFCVWETFNISLSFALKGVLAKGSNLLAEDFLCFLNLQSFPTPRVFCPWEICRARVR